MRYTVFIKAEIVAAVENGTTTLESALAEHNITEEEFFGWQRRLDRAGRQGLRITRSQQYASI